MNFYGRVKIDEEQVLSSLFRFTKQKPLQLQWKCCLESMGLYRAVPSPEDVCKMSCKKALNTSSFQENAILSLINAVVRSGKSSTEKTAQVTFFRCKSSLSFLTSGGHTMAHIDMKLVTSPQSTWAQCRIWQLLFCTDAQESTVQCINNFTAVRESDGRP